MALDNGLVAVLRDEGVLITRRGSAGTAVPDGSSLFGRSRLAANDRLVADFIGARGVSLGRGVDRESLTGRVGDVLNPHLPHLPPIVVRRGTYSRKATLDETAIEAPFRLQVSPTRDGHWVHASRPFRRRTRRVTSSCGTPASTPAPGPPRTCFDPAGRRTTRPASSVPSGPATVTPSRPRSGGTRTSTGAPGCSAPTS